MSPVAKCLCVFICISSQFLSTILLYFFSCYSRAFCFAKNRESKLLSLQRNTSVVNFNLRYFGIPRGPDYGLLTLLERHFWLFELNEGALFLNSKVEKQDTNQLVFSALNSEKFLMSWTRYLTYRRHQTGPSLFCAKRLSVV